MRNSTLKTTVKKAGLVLLTALALTGAVNAQNINPKFKEKAIKNLLIAIQHENDGIRKDAAYYSALYSIDEAVPTLIDQLYKEKQPKIRLLMALALYKIGDPEGIEAVYQLSMKEPDAHVRRMCNAIVMEYRAAAKEVASK